MLKDGRLIREQMYSYLVGRYQGVTAPNWSVRKMLETAYTFTSEERQFKELCSYVNISPKMKVLEAGCGFGHPVAVMLSHRLNCYGYEVDEKLVDIGRRILKANHHDPGRISLVKNKKLPYDNETFDFINLNFVIDYVSDIPALLKELKRVLKKNGRIYIVAPNYQCCFTPIYALVFFPWFPKWLNRIYFHLKKRPNTKVIESLTFVHPRYLEPVFSELNFKFENLGLTHWQALIDRRNVANRNGLLLKVIDLAHNLGMVWVLRLFAKLGFYTPLVYVLTK